MQRKPKIGFVFLVEEYQAWHMAPFAAAMHRCDWAETDSFYNHASTGKTLKHLYHFLKTPQANVIELKKSLLSRLLHFFGVNDPAKREVLRGNKRRLAEYDLLIGTENTLTYLQDFGLEMPPMIMVEHGAMGGCKVIDEALRKRFDKIFFDSGKTASQCLKRGEIRPEQIAVTGYQKIELCDALNRAEPMPPSSRPFILYNAHTRAGLCSVKDFLFPIARAVSQSETHNLIVAPHSKFQEMKFTHRFRLFKRLARLNLPHVKVDMNSRHLVDMSYTRNADIYIGDISSQIYEFLRFPRPCIFLNPTGMKWENDPDLAFWKCGEVITDPADIAAAIERAPALHENFLPAQKELMDGLFEEETLSPSERAVIALKDFLKEKKILN